MKSFYLCIVIFLNIIVAQEKEVCFTFDDLPVVSYNKGIDFQKQITEKLLLIISEYRIPAIGFVNEKKLYTDGKLDLQKVNLLRNWLLAGLELGNHTYSHMDYHQNNFKEYSEDIIRGEQIIKQISSEYNRPVRFFRHPFLRAGETKEKADSLSSFLNKMGYIIAPVTIDNSDWIFASAYSKTTERNDSSLMKKIGEEYISYMEKKLKYWEGQSKKLFGYNMKHILLLHANTINADYLDELAEMYKSNGYKFITLEEALKDKAYLTDVTKFKRWGISWLDRWAVSAGKEKDFFKDEPFTPDYIMKIAGVDSE